MTIKCKDGNEKPDLVGPTFLFKMDVEGIGPVKALIDSGADRCLIRRDLFTPIMSNKIKPLKSTVSLFDQSKLDIEGCIRLNVSYLGSKVVEIPFMVVADLADPMVIGANWIRKSRAVLQSDGERLKVNFSGRKENEDCKTICSDAIVTVDVDGIDGLVRAMVDTGASKSTIRKDLLKDLHMSKAITVFETATMINGATVTKLGLVSLNIKYQDINTEMETVSFAENMYHPLILGMDWIHKTRVVIQSDGSNLIVSQQGLLPQPKKRSKRIIAWLVKKWKLTFESLKKKKTSI